MRLRPLIGPLRDSYSSLTRVVGAARNDDISKLLGLPARETDRDQLKGRVELGKGGYQTQIHTIQAYRVTRHRVAIAVIS